MCEFCHVIRPTSPAGEKPFLNLSIQSEVPMSIQWNLPKIVVKRAAPRPPGTPKGPCGKISTFSPPDRLTDSRRTNQLLTHMLSCGNDRPKMAVHVRKLTLFALTLLWLAERSTDCSTYRFKLPGVWNAAGAKLMTKLQLMRATAFANKRGTNWKHQLLRKPWLFSIGLLLLCGDTHPNPGPTTVLRYPCVSCNDEVLDQGICCDGCQRWCHPKCAFVSDEEYLRLGSCSDTWLCPTCCLPSFTTSLFDLSDHTVSEGHDANLPNYPNSVSVTHLNARSLLPHMDEISLLATNHLIDVITLSETWLAETVSDAVMTSYIGHTHLPYPSK